MTTLASPIDTAIRVTEFRSVALSAKIETIVVQQYVIEQVNQALVTTKSEAEASHVEAAGLKLRIWLDERPDSPLTRALGAAIQDDLNIWTKAIIEALGNISGADTVDVLLHWVNAAKKNGFVIPRLQLAITINF